MNMFTQLFTKDQHPAKTGSVETPPLQDKELLYAAVLSVVNGVVITNSDGAIEWVNPAFTTLTGYTFDEVKGKNPRILKSGKLDSQLYVDLWNTITQGNVWRGTLINKRKDGVLYHEEMTVTPVSLADGTKHFIAVKQDVTKRVEAEERLVESERQYRSVFESSPEVILLLSTRGTVQKINARVYDWLGYEPDELIGKNIIELPFLTFTSKTLALEKYGERMLGKTVKPYELEMIAKDQSIKVGRISGTVIKDSNGENEYDLVMVSDVTEQKRVEQHNQQKTKEIEDINKLMIGRELKIVELKHEIEQLKQKSGTTTTG